MTDYRVPTDDKRDTALSPSDRSLDTAERRTGSASKPAGPETPPRGRAHPAEQPPGRTRVGALWAGMILGAVVLVVLLAFVVQNGSPVDISFFVWAFTLPTGVALLLAAVAGLLVVAIPGSLRMVQLRRAAHRSDRQQDLTGS